MKVWLTLPFAENSTKYIFLLGEWFFFGVVCSTTCIVSIDCCISVQVTKEKKDFYFFFLFSISFFFTRSNIRPAYSIKGSNSPWKIWWTTSKHCHILHNFYFAMFINSILKETHCIPVSYPWYRKQFSLFSNRSFPLGWPILNTYHTYRDMILKCVFSTDHIKSLKAI